MNYKDEVEPSFVFTELEPIEGEAYTVEFKINMTNKQHREIEIEIISVYGHYRDELGEIRKFISTDEWTYDIDLTIPQIYFTQVEIDFMNKTIFLE